MANLEESAVWTPGVYQIEKPDPVLGGPVQPAPAVGGLVNRAALALANRTTYLKSRLEEAEQNLYDGLQNAADALAQTSTALQTQIAQKADIDSPTLTGEPTAPTPPAADNSQRIATTAHVHAAIAASFLQALSIAALPTENVGPIIVIEASEIWVWVETAHYTGYRSPLCGRPVDGHTVTPLPNEIDAVGGLVSKAAYAGLWGYAKENSLVVSQSVWSANIGAHWFVDVSSSQFRVPDLRNQFRRYTGTDADSANERGLGSAQKDAMQRVQGNLGGVFALLTSGPFQIGDYYSGAVQTVGVGHHINYANYDSARVARTSTETRSSNTAFQPRIHV